MSVFQTPYWDPEIDGPMPSEKKAEPKSDDNGSSGRWWATFCAFVGHAMRDVSPAAAVVWFTLFRNSRQGEVQIAIERLGEVCGMSTRTVRRGLRELVTKGLLVRTSKGGRNAGPSRYRLGRIRTEADS